MRYHRKPEDDHMAWHIAEFFRVMGLIITILVILNLFSGCQSYVDYLNNTPVRTVTVDRTPYYNNYNSFYNPYGIRIL